MNHRSERQSPCGSTALWCHCSKRCVFVNDPSFSVCAAAGSRNTSVAMSCGAQLAGFDLGRVAPKRGALDLLEVTHDQPVELGHREPVELGVRGPDRRVLPQQEEAVHLAVAHVEHRRIGGVVAVDARKPVEAEPVFRAGRVAPPRLQQTHHVRGGAAPVARPGRVRLDVALERGGLGRRTASAGSRAGCCRASGCPSSPGSTRVREAP